MGEQKASIHPIGTGPYRHVEGKEGDYHRFEAVANHWRHPPSGCRFHPRCQEIEPPLREQAPGHLTACHLYDT